MGKICSSELEASSSESYTAIDLERVLTSILKSVEMGMLINGHW